MSNQLTKTERKFLLNIARESIVSQINSGRFPEYTITDERLLAKQGCFVTIMQDDRLRGCLGQFTSDKPLWQLVREMAIAAATRDPRFYPMKSEDLQNFTLEISVLSPLKKIESVQEIVVGVHGLYIEKNFYRGVLLPQVAVEYNWDRDTFLDQTCLKAGLEEGAWRDEADIYIFSAQVFSED